MDLSDSNLIASWFGNELQCHTCKNVLSDPRSLDCSHSFCLECLRKVNYNTSVRVPSSYDDDYKRSISCPVCDEGTLLTSRDLSSLKTDLSVTHLLESLANLGLRHRYNDGPTSHMIAEVMEESIERIDELQEVTELPSFVTSAGSQSSLELGSLESEDQLSGNTNARVVGVPPSSKLTHGAEGSIRPLRSWTQTESSAASNKVRRRQDSSGIDSSNVSLAFSTDPNTATEKSVLNETPSMSVRNHGQSGTDESDKSVTEPANVTLQRFCKQHAGTPLRLYCSSCRLAICHSCAKSTVHCGHTVEDLQDVADLMRRELEVLIEGNAGADNILDKALRTLISQQNNKNSIVDQLDAIAREIETVSQTMISEIRHNMNKLMAEVKRLRQASSLDQLHLLRRDIQTGRRIATVVKRRGDSVDVVNTHKAISKKLKRAANLCAEGGAIDQIQEIAVWFSPITDARTGLTIGDIREEPGWKLQQEIPIPLDKRGTMQGMTSLSGHLAIGYEKGGIDVFDLRKESKRPHVRLLPDVQIIDLVSTLQNTFMVYPMFGDIKEVTLQGKELPNSFPPFTSKEHVSLSRSADGRIFLAFAEFREIRQFPRSGGAPVDIVSTSEFKPQQIDVTLSGNVLFKDKTGVKILDLPTKDVRTVVRAAKGKFVYCTCDVNDGVYVAEVAGCDGKTAISKYTIAGQRVETLCEDVTMHRSISGHHWLRLHALSPFKLAVCDGSIISIFQRRPSIIEMANEMNV